MSGADLEPSAAPTASTDAGLLDAPVEAKCLGCGYALRGLTTSNCPECGRAFDPADASTYRRHWWAFKWRTWARPPRLRDVIAACWWTLWIIWLSSLPAYLPGFVIFVLLGLPWMLAIVLEYARRAVAVRSDRQRAKRDRGDAPRGGAWRWWAIPLAIAVMLSTYWPWPLYIRFALSRAAFEQAAVDYLDGRRSGQSAGWIGFYYVKSIERPWWNVGDLAFEIDDGLGFNTRGFVRYAAPGCDGDGRVVAEGWRVASWGD